MLSGCVSREEDLYEWLVLRCMVRERGGRGGGVPNGVYVY